MFCSIQEKIESFASNHDTDFIETQTKKKKLKKGRYVVMTFAWLSR